MKTTLLVTLFLLSFSGCDLFKSENEIKNELAIKKDQIQKHQEIEKSKLETQKSLAIIEKDKELEIKKSLAMIEKAKVLEQKRLDVELKSKELELEQAKIDAKLKHQQLLREQDNMLRLEQYGFALLALIVVVGAFFIFYYFKKRREDEIRAYKDNLEKYFRQKEEAARLKIAEKVLDTIATGKLNEEQESRLIAVFNGDKNQNFSAEVELLEAPDDKMDSNQ